MTATLESPPTWAWRSGACTALEHSFELYIEPPEVRPRLEPIVAPFRAASRDLVAPRRYEVRRVADRDVPFELSCDGEDLASGRCGADLTGALAWHINQSVINQSVSRYVLMHAAAASAAGITVILPADMESGKTTTVAGLLRSGFDYVTDEAVAIDPDSGWISPFPKTLSIDKGSWHLFPECEPAADSVPLRQWHVPPSRLGARAVPTRVPPPKVIVFPKFVRDATTQLHPISKGEAVQELSRMCFHFPPYAGRNLAVLARIVATATVARLTIGSLDGAIDAIEELVSQRILEDL